MAKRIKFVLLCKYIQNVKHIKMKRKEIIQKSTQDFVKWEPLLQRVNVNTVSKADFNSLSNVFYNYENFLKAKDSFLCIGDIKPEVAQKTIKNSLVHKLSNNVHIEVDGTKVILSGVVNSYYKKNEAEKMALNEDGVLKVENHLIIEYDYSLLDYVY